MKNIENKQLVALKPLDWVEHQTPFSQKRRKQIQK